VKPSRAGRFDEIAVSVFRLLVVLFLVGFGLWICRPHIDGFGGLATVSRVRADLRAIAASLEATADPGAEMSRVDRADPFGPKGARYGLLVRPNEIAVYSIGPDRQDDQALIAYDPTNGEASGGDIFRTVRRRVTSATGD
jgi:hypothetical protein